MRTGTNLLKWRDPQGILADPLHAGKAPKAE
jgi:hypothetical protein